MLIDSDAILQFNQSHPSYFCLRYDELEVHDIMCLLLPNLFFKAVYPLVKITWDLIKEQNCLSFGRHKLYKADS